MCISRPDDLMHNILSSRNILLAFRFASFRCHETIVVAQTETNETFCWGEIKTDDRTMVIKRPLLISGLTNPRDMCGQAMHPGTWGVAYINRTGRRFYD